MRSFKHSFASTVVRKSLRLGAPLLVSLFIFMGCFAGTVSATASSGNIGTSSCKAPTFFGLPVWYEYLQLKSDCTPNISSLADIWLIVAAVIEILLQFASLAAIAFVLIGGTQFLASQGEPDRLAKARKTIIGALLGLIISVGAATIISFVAGRFH